MAIYIRVRFRGVVIHLDGAHHLLVMRSSSPFSLSPLIRYFSLSRRFDRIPHLRMKFLESRQSIYTAPFVNMSILSRIFRTTALSRTVYIRIYGNLDSLIIGIGLMSLLNFAIVRRDFGALLSYLPRAKPLAKSIL